MVDPTYNHDKDFAVINKTLNKGATPSSVEFYLPGERILFGSSNNDQIGGEDRTIDDWSPYGEPTGINGMDENNESIDIQVEDTTPTTPIGTRIEGWLTTPITKVVH